MTAAPMTERTTSRPLRTALGPAEVLRLFRDRDRLVGLVGAWAGGGAVVAFDPVRRTNLLHDVRQPATAWSEAGSLVGGGWFGVLGYQLGATIEDLSPPPPRVHPGPECDLAYYDHVLRYAADTGEWSFEGLPGSGRDLDVRYRAIEAVLRGAECPGASPFRIGDFVATPSLRSHQAVVDRVLAHISAGDVFQVNACLRLSATFEGDPLDVFLAGVEELAPEYAAFVRTDHGAVASLSPELYLERRGRSVRTAPIKGTAPLTSDPRALVASAKDRSENVMIVDLMRNDLGRVCVSGSVRASAVPSVRRKSGVWHLVSEVSGRLRDEVDDLALIRATFPPGSVTGAPKIRAMELINNLEATAREAYTGAIGWCGPAGAEFNVAIRTFEFAGGQSWLGVGGGIVTDSVAEREVEECFVKARPLIDAIGARLSPEVETALDELARAMPTVAEEDGADDRDTMSRRRSPASSGRVHVLDERIVVDPDVVADPRGAALLAQLSEREIPVAVRPLRHDERDRVQERFGIGSRERRAHGAGPLERWLRSADVGALVPRPPAPHRRSGATARVLLVDNYDSFVFNLAQYCTELGADVEVVRNDRFDVAEVVRAAADGQWDRVLVSPGPGSPEDAGSSIALVRALPPSIPVLGVCLGLQAIGVAFGGVVGRAPAPVHGRHAIVHHDGEGVFAGLDGPIVAARYHSLAVDEGSLTRSPLRVTARTPSGIVMAIRHLDRPVEGLQIHPESLLTPRGHHLVGNFIRGVDG